MTLGEPLDLDYVAAGPDRAGPDRAGPAANIFFWSLRRAVGLFYNDQLFNAYIYNGIFAHTS